MPTVEDSQLGNFQNYLAFSRDKNNINTFGAFENARWIDVRVFETRGLKKLADPENLSFLLRDEDRRDPICPNSDSRFQKSFKKIPLDKEDPHRSR